MLESQTAYNYGVIQTADRPPLASSGVLTAFKLKRSAPDRKTSTSRSREYALKVRKQSSE